MKFFLFDDPARPGEFARFSHVGTWTPGSVCKECGLSSAELIEPLQIEWNPGTERIGDFSWCGYTCVVTDKVRHILTNTAFECGFGRVDVMPPAEKTRMPRVPFPYSGPILSWLVPNKRLRLDAGRSGVKLVSDCSQCGQKHYTFKREGLIIDARDWFGEKIFHIEQFGKSGATYVTELGLDTLSKEGFTNLCPRLVGNIEQA